MTVSTTRTIAAVATPAGHGGVGIIRVSGSLAREIVCAHFVSSRPGFRALRPYRLHHGHFLDQHGNNLDEVLVSFMPAPGSYTGEDVVEINCHGSPMVLQRVLEVLLVHDHLAPANPGEFTQRAFLNGRMDLTQAEAVEEIIAADSPSACLQAQDKLSGALRAVVTKLKTDLETLRAQLCLAMDFPDEDIECLAPHDFRQSVTRIQTHIQHLISNREQNRIWNHGALCVLAGAVNAGKSSLLNLLLGRQRAIVSPEPGTTRDYLEERIFLQGLAVRLVDTAGLRGTDHQVEQEGLEFARTFRDQADLILLVVDNAIACPASMEQIQANFSLRKTLVAANKCDLPPDPHQPATDLANFGFEVIPISAKTGEGVDQLTNRIRARLTSHAPEPRPGTLNPNLRQSQALRRAQQELHGLQQDIALSVPYDLLSVRLEAACTALAEITGEITTEDVLNDIFSSFCIGK